MRTFSFFTVLLLVTALVGCSSSKDLTSPPDRPASSSSPGTTSTTQRPSSTEEASAEEASAKPVRITAPADWLHRDPESTPFPGIGAENAYRTFLQNKQPKKQVVVAVLDGGVDITHEDLQGSIWTNEDEVPGNDKDDDQNGYVDDVHGWNFIGGPNGKNVNHDTYELTRLYDRLADQFANADTAQLSPETNEAYARYLKLKKEFERERKKAKQRYANVQQTAQILQGATDVLKKHLGVDELDRDQVAAIDSAKTIVRRAQEVLMYFYNQDITPEDINEYKRKLENDLEYGYNRDFNPRPIVGDNYEDVSERIYGNNDVTGPDAEHGTLVAGIIAAQRNNGIGVDGVANHVRIMSVRTVPNGDERDKDVANAIRYAVDNGADVINMSFGKSYSPHKEAVDAAVRYADEHGVLMVHAAGNDGANIDTTDSHPTDKFLNGGSATNWIEVGASSWKGGNQLAASFSNYGAHMVDVFAPGVSIHSTAPNQRYDSADGTSMAAPVVSGLAALLMAYHPELTVTQVRDVILSSATTYSNQQVATPGHPNLQVDFATLSATGGIVNAYRAVQQIEHQSE